MAAKFNVLLCGTGENAAWHLAESRRSRAAARAGVAISHVYGRDRDRTEGFARRNGLKAVADLDGFLRSGQVQGVDVCTVHARHAPLAAKAVETGLAVLVEKPLAVSLADGRALVGLARAKGTPLGVLYHKRYAPQHARMKEFVEVGGFGPGPIEVEMSIHHAADSRYFRHGEHWKASVDLNGGGILMNQVLHYLDLLAWWLGRPEKVESRFVVGQNSMEGESTADLFISFQAGHTARFKASVAVRKSLPVYWAAHGRRGSVVFHGMELIRDSIGIEAYEPFRIRPAADRLLGRVPYRLRRRFGLPLTRLDDESAGTAWEEFFRAAAGGQPPPVSGEEGLKVLELVEMAYGGERPRAPVRPGMIPPAYGVGARDYYLEVGRRDEGLDVLLVNPLMISDYNRAHAHIHTHRPRPPLGLASTTAWLRRAGFTALTVDAAGLGFDLAQTAELIRTFEPRMLVVTTAQLDRWQNPDLDISPAAELIAAAGVKPTVLVGPHASATPEWALRKTGADLAVQGEPERTVTELAQDLLDGAGADGVAGAFRLDNGRLAGRPRIFDDGLDDYPYPAYEDLPLARYEYTSDALPAPYTSMLSSRGCPARCIFCLKAMMPGKWRAQSPERVVGEMEYLHRTYGVRSVYFQDWEFLHDKDRAARLAGLIVEKGLDVRWGISARLSNLTDAGLLKLLTQGGCSMINAGYETGSQELLNKVKKGVTIEAARQAVRNCQAAGIELRLFGLVNLPGEKLRTIRESMKFLADLGTEVVHPNLPIPYPTTKLGEMAEVGPAWENLDKNTGRTGTSLPPRLAVEYFKHLNRNRRFGRGYLFRPAFWRHIRVRRGIW